MPGSDRVVEAFVSSREFQLVHSRRHQDEETSSHGNPTEDPNRLHGAGRGSVRLSVRRKVRVQMGFGDPDLISDFKVRDPKLLPVHVGADDDDHPSDVCCRGDNDVMGSPVVDGQVAVAIVRDADGGPWPHRWTKRVQILLAPGKDNGD